MTSPRSQERLSLSNLNKLKVLGKAQKLGQITNKLEKRIEKPREGKASSISTSEFTEKQNTCEKLLSR